MHIYVTHHVSSYIQGDPREKFNVLGCDSISRLWEKKFIRTYVLLIITE